MTTGEIYEYLFRSTSDGILIADDQMRLSAVNPAAAAMLRVTIEELIGMSPERVLSKQPALVNLFIRSGDQVLDVRLPKRRLAAGMATSLRDGSRLVLLHDVTEARELESRREALVTVVAHDLRNPISALGGYAELVEKFGELNDNQRRFTQRIQQTAAKLYDVTAPLVDLAWIEAGLPLEHTPIQLSTTIRKVVHALSPLAHTNKITIAISVQSPMPPVMGDPERIELAIHNLLHNAIVYSMPEQTVAVHAWGDTHEAYCSIADQGIGIADDELELIFDRLYRSRDPRVAEIPGGGLGLTMARTIIRRHGGDVWGTSNLNAGSTFTFVLPAIREG